MSESPERPRLSGLARSIDSLFSSAPADEASPPGRDAPALVESSAEPAASSPGPRAVPPMEERPLSDAFPASQMLDAIQTSPPPRTPVEPHDAEPPILASGTEPMPESLLTFDSHFDAQSDTHPEQAEDRALDIASTPAAVESSDIADAAPTGPSSTPGASVDATVESDPAHVLEQAVESYIAGDRDARERIETAASALRDRLALDPLADAVEKLVWTAGDPPHPEYIELARTVMNPAVASRLVQRMGRERDGTKRAEYAALCRRLGRVMANGLKGALTGKLDDPVRRVYLDAMISMGDESRAVIEAMVADDNRFLVCDAVVMLGEIGGPRAVELVTSALADTDPRVRAKALHALAELGDADAGRLALGFFEDSDPNVRVAAAVAAGRLRVERSLRPILGLLDQEEAPDKRALLLDALGELGDPGAVSAIEKHVAPSRFSKGATEVRVAGYRALHRIGTPHAREVVSRAANDKDPAVRVALRGLVQES